MCLGMMLRSKLSWKHFLLVGCCLSHSHLLLLLVFEPECCLDATSLVQESSPHVDIADVPEVPACEVDTQVEDDVCHQLLGVSWAIALKVLVVVGDDVG